MGTRSILTGLVFVVLSLTVPLSFGQSCSKDKSCDTPSCCSQWGFCGFGPDFCGPTCVRDCNLRPECGQYSLTPECPLKVCCSQYGFCGTTSDFCTQCQSNCNSPAKQTCATDSAKLRIGYFESWARDRTCYPFFADNVNPQLYTHLNYAFGQISNGVMVAPTGVDLTEIQAFNALKSVNSELKTLISVGGWAFNDPGPTQQEFHNIILTSASRQKFINSVQNYLSTYGFDGIDIDYEYPSAPDRGGHPEDKSNYVQLVKEMRAAFGSKYLISIAAPASYWYLQNFAIGEMSKYLDFINVMTYDIHGTWDADIESLGPVVRSHTNIKEVQSALDLFLRDGVPSQKLVLGLAYYGRAFQLADPTCNKVDCKFKGPAKAGPCTNSPGTLAWFEIRDIIEKTKAVPVYDADSMSKILTFDSDQWVAYDDDETLILRQNFAGENCLLGTMIWSIDQGIDQTSGSRFLTRNGKLYNINFVDLYLIYVMYGDFFRLRYELGATYRYAGDEISATIVNVHRPSSTCAGSVTSTILSTPTATSTCTATATPTPQPNHRPNDPNAFFAAIISTLETDPVVYDYFERIDIADRDPTDPTEIIYLRPINGGVRVEYAEALIFPHHLDIASIEENCKFRYNDGDRTYMFEVLHGAIWMNATGFIIRDEAGHVIGACFGGRASRVNLVPMTPYFNANRGRGNFRSTLVTYPEVEAEMRRFLHNEADAGRADSYVQFRVSMHYEDLEIGRPHAISFQALEYQNGNLFNTTESYFLCNGGPGDTSCPDDVMKTW